MVLLHSSPTHNYSDKHSSCSIIDVGLRDGKSMCGIYKWNHLGGKPLKGWLVMLVTGGANGRAHLH